MSGDILELYINKPVVVTLFSGETISGTLYPPVQVWYPFGNIIKLFHEYHCMQPDLQFSRSFNPMNVARIVTNY